MGICERLCNGNKNKISEEKENPKQITDEYIKNNIENQLYPGGTKKISKIIIDEAAKSICKISFLKVYGTGFFLWTSFNGAKSLITNYHVINPDIIKKNISITLETYNKKLFTLNLANFQNYIQFFEVPDITVIKINSLENLCQNVLFLEFDMNYINGYNNYLNKDVFTLGYPLGKDLGFSQGEITDVTDNLFHHNCDTDRGYSGSPIILSPDKRVIGIHRGGLPTEKINIGTFLGTIFEKENKIININDGNCKINDKKGIINGKKTNQKIANYIVAEYYIDESNVNKDIRIINSYESEERKRFETGELLKDQFIMAYLGLINIKDKLNQNEVKFDENKKNENDIKNCQIYIEDKKIPFSYFYNFKKSGKYKIIFSFHCKLKSLCSMFFSCESLTNIDLSNLNSDNIITMSFMFYDCKSLRNINFSNFNTEKVITMEGMFADCESLRNLNLSNFNTEKVINIKGMFEGCNSLKELDLSNFKTEKVIDMSELFCRCQSLKNLDLSNFNTKNVKTMSELFSNCKSLVSINISSFNTQKVTDMYSMFSKCKSLIKLDLSNFNTKNVINMENMFSDCGSLKYLDLNNFTSQIVTNIKGMFRGTKINISDIICYDKKIIENFVKESFHTNKAY